MIVKTFYIKTIKKINYDFYLGYFNDNLNICL